jgi:outer membrane protein assembly factor BamB
MPEWDMYLVSYTGTARVPIAYGKMFAGNYGGVLYAYDIKTGEELWKYTLAGIGHESPYGNYQITFGGIADEKVYIYSTEHSPTQPLWRGSYLRCIDANTGKELWKSLNFVSGISR